MADGFRALVFTRLAALAERQGGELLLESGAGWPELPPAVRKLDEIEYRRPWRLPAGA